MTVKVYSSRRAVDDSIVDEAEDGCYNHAPDKDCHCQLESNEGDHIIHLAIYTNSDIPHEAWWDDDDTGYIHTWGGEDDEETSRNHFIGLGGRGVIDLSDMAIGDDIDPKANRYDPTRMCATRQGDWVCNRNPGHHGPHVAWNMDEGILQVWDGVHVLTEKGVRWSDHINSTSPLPPATQNPGSGRDTRQRAEHDELMKLRKYMRDSEQARQRYVQLVASLIRNGKAGYAFQAEEAIGDENDAFFGLRGVWRKIIDTPSGPQLADTTNTTTIP